MGIDSAYTLALEHHRAGRLAEAEAIYRQILAQRPDHAKALEMLGVLSLQRDEPRAAVELLERATSLSPHDPHAWINLGEAYRGIARDDRAVDALQRAIAL